MTNNVEQKPEEIKLTAAINPVDDTDQKVSVNSGLSLEDDVTIELRKELERFKTAFPKRVKLENETIEKGLAQLVLTLIEILRGVLEKQAIRKMDNQTLSDEETERVGAALMKLDEKITELCEHFGIDRKDLDLQLGPLDDLI
ncbi:MAG: gas vesicle protein K [Chloroherpetonaceae bacterium]|nr:gas vesicle protein K [Chloroherpetonaceae bacterium]